MNSPIQHPYAERTLAFAYTFAFARNCRRIETACFKRMKREPFRSVRWKISARAQPNWQRGLRGASVS